MPNSKKAFRLTADYVEMIHDEVVPRYWPAGVSLNIGSRDRALLESACARPFQTAFGEEGYPSIHEKGAVLFHGLIANHPFHDGNKRTAVIALDLFLPKISLESILAKILETVRDWAVPFTLLGRDSQFAELYKQQLKLRAAIRQHKLNRVRKGR